MWTVKLVKVNKIVGSWGDLGVPVVIHYVVVSPVLRIFWEMCRLIGYKIVISNCGGGGNANSGVCGIFSDWIRMTYAMCFELLPYECVDMLFIVYGLFEV
jgi:hypothetical protein